MGDIERFYPAYNGSRQNFNRSCIFVFHYENFITKTCLFKYTEKLITEKLKIFSQKKSNIFHISAQNIDCGYSLEPPRRNKKNNVYPCKSQFYYIKVGFKGVKII